MTIKWAVLFYNAAISSFSNKNTQFFVVAYIFFLDKKLINVFTLRMQMHEKVNEIQKFSILQIINACMLVVPTGFTYFYLCFYRINLRSEHMIWFLYIKKTAPNIDFVCFQYGNFLFNMYEILKYALMLNECKKKYHKKNRNQTMHANPKFHKFKFISISLIHIKTVKSKITE